MSCENFLERKWPSFITDGRLRKFQQFGDPRFGVRITKSEEEYFDTYCRHTDGDDVDEEKDVGEEDLDEDGNRKTSVPCKRADRLVKHYLPAEVILHNRFDDLWISFLGKVYDLTELSVKLEGQRCMKPLLANAGRDVSHWFDKRTGDLKRIVHNVTGLLVPYVPQGTLPDVHPQVPSANWQPLQSVPWWLDEKKYLVGLLTKKPRPIRILNSQISSESTDGDNNILWVCSEDKLSRILERMSEMGSDVSNYIVKYLGVKLDLNKTLEQNRVFDEREQFLKLGLPDNFYIPALQLYSN